MMNRTGTPPVHTHAMSMTRLLVATMVVALFASTVFAGLADDVRKLVREAPLKGGVAAVSVRDAETGVELVAIKADQPMIPASNMKLLTTGAALHALGGGFEFTTRLVRDGDRLIVIGDGDPAFGDPAMLGHMHRPDGRPMDVDAFVNVWVDVIVATGETHWREIVVDDRIFDREFVPADWPADQLNLHYCAQSAGLNFHANVLHFFPQPRAGGRPDVSDMRPRADWINVANVASSDTAPHERSTAWISRKHGTNELKVHGNVKNVYREPVQVTLHDVPSFFARLLSERLSARGIKVDRARIAEVTEPESTGEVVGPVITTPIETVVTECNVESRNLYAECLLKRIGAKMTGEPGSWLNGAAIIRHIVNDRVGDPALVSGLVVADGSGMSRGNRVPARTMTAWLCSFHHDDRVGSMYINSLAVAGENGTLATRFDKAKLRGAKVQAKTGYINEVSCLSGFITMPDGRRRVFSILVNELTEPASVRSAKLLQEQVMQAVIDDMAVVETALGGD